jgi:methionyl-tRNA formyltransferase
MRVVFMGSADIACPSLEALLHEPGIEIIGVVTQPDRPKGRRLQLAACSVKQHVAASGIPVFSPQSINTDDSLNTLCAWQPDLAVVAAYGQILKPAVLELPRFGCINVHTSLLPRYRGAAPIQWAIANGDTETGVTIMHMDEGMDTGDMIAQRMVSIERADTASTLHDRLGAVGAALLCEVVRDLQAGCATRTPQDASQATYAPKLTKHDGRIDWTHSADAIYNRIRGFNPWPCCYCVVPAGGVHKLRVLSARIENGEGRPGEVLDIKGDGPLVACADGAVRLLDVQPEGKRVMRGNAFVCGHTLQRGELLG